MRAVLDAGHRVIGIEAIDKAVLAFFQENNIAYDIETDGDETCQVYKVNRLFNRAGRVNDLFSYAWTGKRSTDNHLSNGFLRLPSVSEDARVTKRSHRSLQCVAHNRLDLGSRQFSGHYTLATNEVRTILSRS
jgi:hypothetical protein